MSAPEPGWYPEPRDERWWDGRTWADAVREPGEAVPEPAVADPSGDPAPGWYPDPLTERYWTGAEWSDQVRPAAPAADDTAVLEPEAQPSPAPALAKAPSAEAPSATVTSPPPPAPPAHRPAPAGGRGRPTVVLAVVGGLGLIALVIAAVALLAGGGGDDVEASDRTTASAPASADDPSAEASSSTTTSTSTSTSTTTTTTAPTTTVDPEQQAQDDLAEQLARDRERVDERVLDLWVPQLSSKKLGLTDPRTGITYDTYQAILEDFRRQRSAYGDVLLIESGAFTTYSQPGLYVTVAAVGFSTPEQANTWCDERGIHPDDCFAKLISRTAPSGPDAQTYRS